MNSCMSGNQALNVLRFVVLHSLQTTACGKDIYQTDPSKSKKLQKRMIITQILEFQ